MVAEYCHHGCSDRYRSLACHFFDGQWHDIPSIVVDTLRVPLLVLRIEKRHSKTLGEQLGRETVLQVPFVVGCNAKGESSSNWWHMR